jgi:rhomboid protease GluP
VTGIAASLTTLVRFLLVHSNGASVGASGAIFGIMGALIVSIRRSPRWKNERWARSIVQQLMFWIVVNIAIGLTVPQIDMAAHAGGFLPIYSRRDLAQRSRRSHRPRP